MREFQTSPVRSRNGYILLGVAILLFTLVWVRTAWMSDDAYITLRTVQNVLQGLGPDFNPGERVQTFTHPLWFLLLIPTHALTGEGFYSTLALSFLVNIATIVVFALFIARSLPQLIFGIGAMVLSKAYMDFTSSGLENPLGQLLLGIFFALLFRSDRSVRGVFWISLTAALGILTRFDLCLLFLPPLALSVYQATREQPKGRVLGAVIMGFVPMALWSLFAFVYYGMLLPNTYYAKSPPNVSTLTFLEQGISYFVNSLRFDPITLSLVALAVGLAAFSRDRMLQAIGIGIVLYLLYVLKIGGDFMSGRFFATAYFCALVILVRVEWLASVRVLAPIAGITIILGLLAPVPTLFTDGNFGAKNDPERIALTGPDRINDQRAFYYHWTGLLNNLNGTQQLEQLTEVREGREMSARKGKIFKTTGLGIRSYFAGTAKYTVDELALADPFLSRLPRREGWWLIGHFVRCLPVGYAKTLNAKVQKPKQVAERRNFIANKALADLYHDTALVSREGIFAPQRLGAIWRMNLGLADGLHVRDYACENFYSQEPDPTITVAKE